MKKVFIDGREGTTGLRIGERLGGRRDIELMRLPEEKRKDPAARKAMLNGADIAFLCLPDAAAVEAVSLIDNPDTVVIDTSTAHRTAPGWLYGFPEMEGGIAERAKTAKRIAVPGCHASGFIALVKPLVAAGFLPRDARLSVHSLTGYSGGGKKMIEQYEGLERNDDGLDAPRAYALGQSHKHLKEMTAVTGLREAPIFCPVVDDYYSGMLVTVPLFGKDLAGSHTMEDVIGLYRALYAGPVVKYAFDLAPDGFACANGLAGKDGMRVGVYGNGERMLLAAQYDNLGKGASGAAVQMMNLALGADMTEGLDL